MRPVNDRQGQPEPTAVYLRLVGSFMLQGDLSGPPPTGRSERLLKLLAAHHDQLVGASVIIEALWGDLPPTGANRNIAALVSRLRGVVGRGAIVGDSRGYRLVTGAHLKIDLAEAEDLIRTAEHELASQSYGLASLAASRAETTLAVAPVLVDEEPSPWIIGTRSRVARKLRTARSVRWTAALACGDLPGAIDSSEAALRDDPLDEDACRAAMQAYWQSGLPASALAAYERVRVGLADSLGIDPAEASQALYLSILHAEPPTAAPAIRRGQRHEQPSAAVGRQAELAQLLSAWSDALAGSGGLCLVIGDAGIGKRTLTAALAGRVGPAGALVVTTRCFEAERSLFLQPLVEAVRGLLLQQTPAAMRELLGDWAGPLAELVPEISQVIGDLPQEQYLPEAHHRRTFEAIAGLFARLERQRPILLIVEALEHASEGTLEALHFIAARLASHRILIVTTVHSADREVVIGALGDAAQQIVLGPLDLRAVEELVRDSGSHLDAARLHELTGGSPLYLTELIRHERDFGADDPAQTPLPPSLRVAISERLALLGSEAMELLELGCIFGESFNLDEVSSLGELSVEQCARRAQRALRAGLLIAHRTNFGFANQILREVLYQSIPEPTRISRHKRAAEILANQPEAAAQQWAAAGDWAFAVDAWRRAAEDAHRALADTEAERLLTAAAEAAELLDDHQALAEVLIRRGQIRCELGRYEDAHSDHAAALVIARDLYDESLEATALEQLGWTALYARDALAAADLAARATKLAEVAAAAPGAPRSAWLLLGRVRHWDGDYQGASDAYDQVLSERPDDEIAAQALTFRGALLQHLDRFEEARKTLAQAVVLCRSNGLIRPLLQSLFFTALAQGDMGDFSSALRSLKRARRLIDDNGVTYYSAGIDTTTSWLLREVGQLEAAREIAERAVESAQRGGGALEMEQGLHAVLAVAECSLVAGDIDAAGSLIAGATPYLGLSLPYHARAELRLLEMQSRFDPALAEQLLQAARTHSSIKYESLALWHLGQLEQAAELAKQTKSDLLIGQMGAPAEAWAAIDRLSTALSAEDRESFLTKGRLATLWRNRTGRLG
jgi:DNA-binding SARP family transcriptional activator/tetratricopeptide (TPR) repeat protein